MAFQYEGGNFSDEKSEWMARGVEETDIPKEGKLRMKLLDWARGEEFIAKWRRLSGLYDEVNLAMQPTEWRRRVRLLMNTAKLIIRRELQVAADDPDGAERTVYWDPLPIVCRELQIARTRLSSLSRDLTGLSAVQLVDCVRVERVSIRMRDELRAFIKALREERTAARQARCAKVTGDSGAALRKDGETGGRGDGEQLPLDKWMVYKALKASRREPEFNHSTWAMGFGFSSYTRFHRACLVVHKCTPHQMELELIEKLLQLDETEPLEDRFEKPVVPLEEIKQKLRELLDFTALGEPWKQYRKLE